MDRKELKKTIAELILREETYADQMEQTVEAIPFQKKETLQHRAGKRKEDLL